MKPGAVVALVRYPVREDHLALVPPVVALADRRQVERGLPVHEVVVQQRHPPEERLVRVEHAVVQGENGFVLKSTQLEVINLMSRKFHHFTPPDKGRPQ